MNPGTTTSGALAGAAQASPTAQQLPPRPGILATVRNRRALVTGVHADDGHSGRRHLVTLEYLDPGLPSEETLLWEAEPGTHLFEPTQLPRVADSPPDQLAHFRALVRATRWSALEPFIDPDGDGGPLDRMPLASPLHGAIQVEDYQMVPLWQAMRMPRVSLLLADDVGLGKTIEAGLILSELVRRRRAKRVLVVCPASLRGQWRQEMQDKFCLEFDIVDRARTHDLQRSFGMDANPWRSLGRIITSYDYLKQPDVLAAFRAASRSEDGAAQLPWDLLVVDEAHNLAPAPMGEESEVAKLLRELSPLFEHRLFLTATPHNGHTSSFTGLLEALDPVRFSRRWEPLTDTEKRRVDQVLVRRLKSEINDRDRENGEVPRFAERTPVAQPLRFGRGETALLSSFSEFRTAVKKLVASGKKSEERAGVFAVEILGKRLLSSPVTFADSWHRYLAGARDEPTDTGDDQGAATTRADAAAVRAAERAVDEELSDDREAERRRTHAVTTVGAWMRPFIEGGQLQRELAAIDGALDDLDLGSISPRTPAGALDLDAVHPKEDARFDALCAVIDGRLRDGDAWRDDERLVVFTEYKTTLDHLVPRLAARYGEDVASGAIRTLYGGLPPSDREAVTDAFNDPQDPIRVLVATDTASEGLNLQETARLLLHFDVPWNPSRLEQRNGRLDRHGQARDVDAYHFESQAEDDVRFLARVVEKIHTQRDDLGSVGEVFDRAFERRLVSGEGTDAVLDGLERDLDAHRGAGDVRAAAGRETTTTPSATEWTRGEEERLRLDVLRRELDLSADSLRETLEVALDPRRSLLDGPSDDQTFKLRASNLPSDWTELIDENLRARAESSSRRRAPKGTLNRLLFDGSGFLRELTGTDGSSTGRRVFRPDPNVALMHLGHPIVHRALGRLASFRFPGTDASQRVSRWTVSRTTEGRAPIPQGADALVLLTVEELAVNELRETFHHWVRAIALPATNGAQGWELGSPLPHRPAAIWHASLEPATDADDRRDAEGLWLDVERDLKGVIHAHRDALQSDLESALAAELETARTDADKLFASRQGELSSLIQTQTLERLEKQIADTRQRIAQPELFDREAVLAELERDVAKKEEEIARRKSHWESLRKALEAERDRVLDRVLPARHTLHDDARVFPVGVEIVLPGASS